MDALSRWGIEARAVCPPPEVRSFHADGVDNAAMPSVIGTLRGGEGPCLLLNAHIDTVPANFPTGGTTPLAASWRTALYMAAARATTRARWRPS